MDIMRSLIRRSDKEIVGEKEIHKIIDRCQFCRIAFCEKNIPYIVPVCFCFHRNFLYFHSANEGLKIDVIKRNPTVCFQMDCDVKLVRAKSFCKWGVNYKSIIGHGVAECIEDETMKRTILSIFKKKYSGLASGQEFKRESLLNTTIIQIGIKSITGKKSGTD